MKIFNVIGVLALAAAMVSCSQRTCSPDEYVAELQPHLQDITAAKTIGALTFSAQWIPADLQILKRFGSTLNQTTLNRERENLSGFEHYRFRVQVTEPYDNVLTYDLRSVNQFEERKNYLAFDAQADFELVCGTDTLPCAIHQFIDSYSISPYVDVVVAFEAPQDPTQDRTIIYSDHLFGSGPIKLKLTAFNRLDIPSLKAEKS